MDLPTELAPWGPELTRLDARVTASLGLWLPRLSSALGPLRASWHGASGELDGLGGISRRGTFDRLLLTDWMLAEEVPDEFLRRAAERELSFLDYARREPSAGRAVIALCDVGPHQLGAPRLVQLALAIVLARRAREARAQLLLGSLQDESSTVRALARPEDLAAWAGSRSPRAATRADLARWDAALPLAGREDEVWLLGAVAALLREGRAIGRFGRARHVAIEPDEPRAGADDAGLTVRYGGPAGHLTCVTLGLPPPAESVALLRRPYGPSPTRGPAGRAYPHIDAHSTCFSPSSSQLILRTDTGVQSLRAGQRTVPIRQSLRTESTLIGVHATRREMHALIVDGDRLALAAGLRRERDVESWPAGELAGASEPPSLRPIWRLANGWAFLGPDGSTLYCVESKRDSPPEVMSRGVLGIHLCRGMIHVVRRHESRIEWESYAPWTRQYRVVAWRAPVQSAPAAARVRALIGGDAGCAIVASWSADSGWLLHVRDREPVRADVRDLEPVGVVAIRGEPQLVLIDAAARRVCLYWPRPGAEMKLVYAAADEIEWAACSGLTPRIALRTADGAIEVIDAPSGDVRLRVAAADETPE